MKQVCELPLYTQRLVLREMYGDDLDFMAAMLANPEVTRFYPQRYSRADAQAWIERQRRRYRDEGHGFWLIEEIHSGKAIGQAGLLLQDVDGQSLVELAYMIDAAHWRQGFAKEAGARVVAAAKAWGYGQVVSMIQTQNLPSRAVALSLGMQYWKRTLHRDLTHEVYRLKFEESECSDKAPQ